MGGANREIPEDLDERTVNFMDKANMMSPRGFKGATFARPDSTFSRDLHEDMAEEEDPYDNREEDGHLRDAGNRATEMSTPTPTPARNGPPGGTPSLMTARNRASDGVGEAGVEGGAQSTSTGGGGGADGAAATGTDGLAAAPVPVTPETRKLAEIKTVLERVA